MEKQIYLLKKCLLSRNIPNILVYGLLIDEIVINIFRELYNIIRYLGKHELLDKIDFRALSKLTNEANNHLSLINLRDSMSDTVNSESLLNEALEDVIFTFSKPASSSFSLKCHADAAETPLPMRYFNSLSVL